VKGSYYQVLFVYHYTGSDRDVFVCIRWSFKVGYGLLSYFNPFVFQDIFLGFVRQSSGAIGVAGKLFDESAHSPCEILFCIDMSNSQPVNLIKSSFKIHLTYWVLFWLVDYLLAYAVRSGEVYPYNPYFLNVVFCTLYFYVCVNLVIEPTIERSKLLLATEILALISAFCIIKWVVEWAFHTEQYVKNLKERKRYFAYFSYEIWRYTTMTFYSFAYWYYKKSMREENLRRMADQRQYIGQIDFLRAQIHPHFLFNTLNLVYSEIAELSEKAGNAVLSLTRLMRFSVESTKFEAISIHSEIEAIEEYLSLQRWRLGEKLNLEYSKSGKPEPFLVPPLCFISLVENAFKYGEIKDPIQLSIDIGEEIRFYCSNSIRRDFKDNTSTSLGLKNVVRQLEMYFGENVKWEIHQDQRIFYVSIIINTVSHEMHNSR
jgi:two-component system LytT family sensor kinase